MSRLLLLAALVGGCGVEITAEECDRQCTVVGSYVYHYSPPNGILGAACHCATREGNR
jgi:hypothetical protein